MVYQLMRTGLVVWMSVMPFVGNATTVNSLADGDWHVEIPVEEFGVCDDLQLSQFGSVILALGDFATRAYSCEELILHDVDLVSYFPSDNFEDGALSFFGSPASSSGNGGVSGSTNRGGNTRPNSPSSGVLSVSAGGNGGSQDISFANPDSGTDNAPAPVPVPAAGLLMMIALGGIAAFGRAKHSA